MKVLIVFDADIVIRHFVMSGVFNDLVAAHDVTFAFLDPAHKRMGPVRPEALDLAGAPYEIIKPDPYRIRLWAELFSIDRLRFRPGRQHRANRYFQWHAIGRKARLKYQTLALPGLRQAFGWLQRKRLARHPNVEIESLLDRVRPDIVIHPCVLNGLFINDLIALCDRRGVPCVTVMNSWDNPATKQAMVGSPDLLLVWGEQSERHAMAYMGMPPERIRRFGAAQFEVYHEPPRLDRETFCAAHKIDPANRILLYAGSSKETDEFGHLQAIDAMIEDGRLPGTSVIYRPHPWGDGGRGGHRLLDHPWRHVRIERSMVAYLEQVRAGNKEKSLPDYRDTRDLLCHIDALVSPLSTIILEAALLGHPVMCFVPRDEWEEAEHLRLSLPSVHFDAMYRMPGVITANGREAMLAALPELLEKAADPQLAADLRKATEFVVAPFEETWGRRMVALVEELGERR